MLTVERYGDVERLLMWTRRSASVGYHVSAYVTRGVVIDTGFPAIGRQLAAWLRATRPRGVVLTHAHEDHAGNIDLVEILGLPLCMARSTLAELQAMSRPGVYRLYTWGYPRRLGRAVKPEGINAPGLAMIHTPGHSPDHQVIWDAERETLFSGDLFLGVKMRMLQPTEDPRAHVASLRAVIALRPTRVFDAHRGLLADPIAMLTAKADWMEATIAAIERRLAEGWSHRAVAKEVLGREGALYYMSGGEYSHRNFVLTVASPRGPAPGQTPPT
jgi:endoribonuclease LACTB2